MPPKPNAQSQRTAAQRPCPRYASCYDETTDYYKTIIYGK